MSRDSLILKYRPKEFGEVIGQDEVVTSFKTALKNNTSHAFLFTGPAGTGKTTLARLGANYVKTSKANLIEIDAASHNGVDDVRNLTVTLGYKVLGKEPSKSLIIDEAHVLSKNGWNAFLKSVEEPPEWVYFFFCTTDAAKVPETIKSRCACYNLKPVKTSELFEFLCIIVELEKFDTPNSIIELCAKQADGSPRKALSNLSVCYGAKDRKEAAKLIANFEIEEGGLPFKLAQAISNGKWKDVKPVLESICSPDFSENPETVRHVVRAYFTKMVIGQTDEKEVCRILKVLDAFSEIYNVADGFTPLVISVGRSLY